MLYGYNINPKTTVVVSAHTEAELKQWYDTLMQSPAVPLYTEQREIGPIDFLMGESYDGLTTEVYEFKFEHDHNQAEFARLNDIHILPRNNAVDRHQDMNYRSHDNYDTDTRTIGEVTGTNENDPWDTTSDEDKEKAKALREMMKKRQQEDEISNDDSFTTPTQGGVHVQSIGTSIDENGKVVVETVSGVKLNGDELARTQEEIERVRSEEYAKGRPAVLDQAVIKDLTKVVAKEEKSKKSKKD